jgi:Uma2 family endonuclease
MAVGISIPVEEYLRTIYHPDCDYVDGEVVERNLGEQSHGRLQFNIAKCLSEHERLFGFRTLIEVRLQVLPNRFRVPDVMLIPLAASKEKIIRTPPLLCIEVLSPEDTLNRINRRVQEYLDIGVPSCWIVDPESGEAWIATPGQLTKVTDGILRAGEIELPLAEVLE